MTVEIQQPSYFCFSVASDMSKSHGPVGPLILNTGLPWRLLFTSVMVIYNLITCKILHLKFSIHLVSVTKSCRQGSGWPRLLLQSEKTAIFSWVSKELQQRHLKNNKLYRWCEGQFSWMVLSKKIDSIFHVLKIFLNLMFSVTTA